MAHKTFWKPKTRKQTKAAKDRAENKIIATSRAACVLRDDACFVRRASVRYGDIGPCHGPSEWMHIPPYTRARTRGENPEVRHSTNRTAMGCRRHHDMIDGRQRPKLTVTFHTDLMANGSFSLTAEA